MPKCKILGCRNYTEAVSGFCLEHEAVVWSMVNGENGKPVVDKRWNYDILNCVKT